MKRRVETDTAACRSGDNVEGRENSKVAHKRRLGSVIFFALKLTVGFGGMALVANPVYFLGESSRLAAAHQNESSASRLAAAATPETVEEQEGLAAPIADSLRRRSSLRGVFQSIEKGKERKVTGEWTMLADRDPDPSALMGSGEEKRGQEVDLDKLPEKAQPQELQHAWTKVVAPTQVLRQHQERQQLPQQPPPLLDGEQAQGAAVGKTIDQKAGQSEHRLSSAGEQLLEALPQREHQLPVQNQEHAGMDSPKQPLDKQTFLQPDKTNPSEQAVQEVQRQKQVPRKQQVPDKSDLATATQHQKLTKADIAGGFNENGQDKDSTHPLSENAVASPKHVTPASIEAVWSALLKTYPQKDVCRNPPCGRGKHMHTEFADFAQEMSRVQGAVVVTRPDLVQNSDALTPANHLDFVKTLQSYFAIFKESLLSSGLLEHDLRDVHELHKVTNFLEAVRDGNDRAGKYLSPYYAIPEVEVPQPASRGYEGVPTVVALPDVHINSLGYVWNEKDYVITKACKTEKFGIKVERRLPVRADSYDKVFVLTQHWGDAYFHFVAECLPRLMLMIDVLLEHPDIKIAAHAPPAHIAKGRNYMHEYLELLGIQKERIIFVGKYIHAKLAFLPESTACGQPNTVMVNMLRSRLLLGMYPLRGGVPRPVPRPVILVIVRESKRELGNNDQVCEALRKRFPTYDVVEFEGQGPILQQLQKFATASLIVAPHGAGLSNIMVSPLHTPVLEIGPSGCSICYMHLAVKLQHIYGRHLGESQWNGSCDRSYKPNVDEIVKLASDLLEAKQLADAADPPTKGVSFEGTAIIPSPVVTEKEDAELVEIEKGIKPFPIYDEYREGNPMRQPATEDVAVGATSRRQLLPTVRTKFVSDELSVPSSWVSDDVWMSGPAEERGVNPSTGNVVESEQSKAWEENTEYRISDDDFIARSAMGGGNELDKSFSADYRRKKGVEMMPSARNFVENEQGKGWEKTLEYSISDDDYFIARGAMGGGDEDTKSFPADNHRQHGKLKSSAGSFVENEQGKGWEKAMEYSISDDDYFIAGGAKSGGDEDIKSFPADNHPQQGKLKSSTGYFVENEQSKGWEQAMEYSISDDDYFVRRAVGKGNEKDKPFPADSQRKQGTLKPTIGNFVENEQSRGWEQAMEYSISDDDYFVRRAVGEGNENDKSFPANNQPQQGKLKSSTGYFVENEQSRRWEQAMEYSISDDDYFVKSAMGGGHDNDRFFTVDNQRQQVKVKPSTGNVVENEQSKELEQTMEYVISDDDYFSRSTMDGSNEGYKFPSADNQRQQVKAKPVENLIKENKEEEEEEEEEEEKAQAQEWGYVFDDDRTDIWEAVGLRGGDDEMISAGPLFTYFEGVEGENEQNAEAKPDERGQQPAESRSDDYSAMAQDDDVLFEDHRLGSSDEDLTSSRDKARWREGVEEEGLDPYTTFYTRHEQGKEEEEKAFASRNYDFQGWSGLDSDMDDDLFRDVPKGWEGNKRSVDSPNDNMEAVRQDEASFAKMAINYLLKERGMEQEKAFLDGIMDGLTRSNAASPPLNVKRRLGDS